MKMTFYRVPPVGISSWHRQWVKGQRAGEASVPCGDCAAPCCTSFEHITVDPRDEDVSQYATRHLPTGEIVLQQHADGSCIYFIDGRCSIHPRRPRVCRVFDCRMYNLLPINHEAMAAFFPSWASTPACRQAELIRDTTNARFALIEKEPDDRTFDERFWDVFIPIVGAHPRLDLSSLLTLALLAMTRMTRQLQAVIDEARQ